MPGLEWPQWSQIFVPDLSLAESALRGTLIYFAILIIFRVVLKREQGGLGATDVMLIVLVSESVSPALTGEGKSVPNGLVTACTLVFWTYALDRLERCWPWLQRLLEPQPVRLIANGRLLHANMEREGVTEEELLSQLRQQGIGDPKRVKAAYMESNGEVSVIPIDEPSAPTPEGAAKPEQKQPSRGKRSRKGKGR